MAQGTATGSAEPVGLLPTEACGKGALRGRPRIGDPLRCPQVCASQQQGRTTVGAG